MNHDVSNSHTAAASSNTGLTFGKLDPASKRLKAVIERRYPGYAAACKEWCFINDALAGGQALAERHLYQHPREEKEIYDRRKERAADNHFPVSQLVADTYEGYTFQQEPTPDEKLDDTCLTFIERADLDGRRLVDFAREVLRWAGGKGRVWACVDKPAFDVPDGITEVTAAMEAEAGVFPYAYLVQPEDVLDGYWEHGELTWLLVREMYRNASDPFSGSDCELKPRWRLWDREKWTLIEPLYKEGVVTALVSTEGYHNLGIVPFVCFGTKEDTGFVSKGLISDVAHLDKAAFNVCSLLDEILYAVTFPQLGIPYSGVLFNEDGLSAEGKTILTMGLHSVIPYHTDSGAPAYIAPPAGPAETLERSIKRVIGLALSLALLDGEIGKPHADGDSGVEATAAASGVSKSYVFEKLNRRLATISDTMEKGFTKLFKVVKCWQGEDMEDLPPVPWDFPDNFEVRSVSQDISEAIALLGLGINGNTLRAHILKSIVRKAFPKLDEVTLKAIDGEIDAGPMTDYDVNEEDDEEDGGAGFKAGAGAPSGPNKDKE